MSGIAPSSGTVKFSPSIRSSLHTAQSHSSVGRQSNEDRDRSHDGGPEQGQTTATVPYLYLSKSKTNGALSSSVYSPWKERDGTNSGLVVATSSGQATTPRSFGTLRSRATTNLGSVSEGAARLKKSTTGIIRAHTSMDLSGIGLCNDSREPLHKVISRAIIDQKYVSAFMMALTVYVLCADDIRLLTTDKPADIAFGFVALVCIALFSLEILFSCLGKPDYFLGFFFFLDVIATGTLILDLPWVLDAMSSEDHSNTAARGRTARVGAKAARFVRVLRLVRVVKLYKAVHESRQRKEQRQRNTVLAERTMKPGEDSDHSFQSDQKQEDSQGEESRVGKRLSELMTRRVIILVLTMLIGVRLLTVEEVLLLPQSASYAAEEVWLAYKSMQHCPLPDESQGEGCEILRTTYEHTMLRLIYYHNWFVGTSECPFQGDDGCSHDYYSHFFLVGFTASHEEARRNATAYGKLRASTVEAFQQEVAEEEQMAYNYGAMPPSVLSILSSDWDSDCEVADNSRINGISLISQKIENKVSYAVKCPHDLRTTERAFYHAQRMATAEYDNGVHLTFWFDKRPFVQEEAAYSLGMTAFVCVCLLGAAVIFHNLVSQLVLYPVEAMIQRVQVIRDNPMTAAKMAEDEYRKEVEKFRRASVADETDSVLVERKPSWRERGKAAFKYVFFPSASPTEPMETLVLERTIIKLGSLLVLGFGEAGANIVTQNMQGSHASVSAMVEGQYVQCIIGNIRIQDFSIVTEVLQSSVMTFVNQVAEIVHGVVEQFHGAPNKNNGDTFLVIWRTTGMESWMVGRSADLSVTAFARILGAVHQAPMLLAYRGHPGLQWRFHSDFRVNVSMGLHYGWAIEGAVGSEYKIDASYLSPNVAVAVNVEDATRIYDVNLLVTEHVVKLCSESTPVTPGMRSVCRLIDKVFIAGSKEPIQLYTVDLCTRDLDEEDPFYMGRRAWSQKMRFKAKQWLEIEKQRMWRDDTFDVFKDNPSIAAMRATYKDPKFAQLFSMGYQNYHEGEWEVAMTFLKHTRDMLGFVDGPSAALMDFLEYHNNEPPDGWDGIRDLEEASNLKARLAQEALQSEADTPCTAFSGFLSSQSGSAQPHSLSRSPSRRKTQTTRRRTVASSRAHRKSVTSLFSTGQSSEGSPLLLGDGTGGTCSRRGSHLLIEESPPLFDFFARFQQADSAAGSTPSTPALSTYTPTPSMSASNVKANTPPARPTTTTTASTTASVPTPVPAFAAAAAAAAATGEIAGGGGGGGRGGGGGGGTPAGSGKQRLQSTRSMILQPSPQSPAEHPAAAARGSVAAHTPQAKLRQSKSQVSVKKGTPKTAGVSNHNHDASDGLTHRKVLVSTGATDEEQPNHPRAAAKRSTKKDAFGAGSAEGRRNQTSQSHGPPTRTRMSRATLNHSNSNSHHTMGSGHQ